MTFITKPLALFVLAISLIGAPLWAHSLIVQIEPPGTAGLVIDRNDSFLADANHQPMAYFGGWDGWGPDPEGPAKVSFQQRADLPKMLNIVWFSSNDNQFWGGRLALPGADIIKLIKQLPNEAFSRLVVSINPKGKLTLWLGGKTHEIQLGKEWQAQATHKDWQTFRPSLPLHQQNHTRINYVKIQQKHHINPYNDELFVLKAGKEPVQDYDYMIVRDDGLSYCGSSNGEGETRRVNTGTQTMKLVLYAGQCPLLEQAQDMPIWPALSHRLLDSVRQLLPY